MRIKKAYEIVKGVREVKPTMPIQQVAMLLLIAMHEGITIPELAEELDTTPQSISRNIQYLSQYRTNNGEVKGLDLIVAHPAFRERRRLACFLTEKGEELMNKIGDIAK